MALAIFGFLFMLVVVLATVLLLRPENFRLKATLTKWVSLDLEMRSRVGPNEPPSSHRDERSKPDQRR
jgi:hypothetical protein